MNLTKYLRVLSLAMFAVLGCDLGGNSGSETTNGLTGKAYDAEGKPVMGARVRLVTRDFDPGRDTATAEATTDGKGGFAMASVAPGLYNLEMREAGQARMALVQDVVIPATGGALANGVLLKPGKATVRFSDFTASGTAGYVFIPGTGTWVVLSADAIQRGEATVDGIPAGLMDSVVLVLSDSMGRRAITLGREVKIVSGEENELPPFATWSYSRSLPLDTKSMGLAENLADFPLLVRLTPEDTLWDQAAGFARDLRFTRAERIPLPYQVERWDSVTRQAEIWVRLDTVHGNATDQGLRMHWGKPDARSESGSSAVFASQSGFATVYHLSEKPNSDAGGYKDASSAGNHATSANTHSNSQVNGIIGHARLFSGTPASPDIALTAAVPQGLSGNSSFSVSFWMRCRALPQRQGILDFGAFDLQKDMHFLLRPDTAIQFGAYDKNVTGADRAPWQSVFKVPDLLNRWAHVATVYDSARGSLEVYIDGARVDSLQVPPMAIDAAGGLRIGRPIWTDVVGSTEYPFNGELDEIRFERRVNSPERIRLDYLTQKP